MSDDQKSALDIAREAAQKIADETNSTRTGISTRVTVGATRGKNPQIISYEQFDESVPDSLPKSHEAFVEFVKPTGVEFLDYLIRGYNAARFEAASDPLAEYVVASWPNDVQGAFRQAVRNYSRGLGMTLEDAAAVIRPGFVKKFGE